MKAGGASYEVIGQDGITGDEEDTLASAEPMIQVKAPATLPEGYKLDVQVGQKTFTVTIPPGGVQEGQTFQVPLPGGSSSSISDFSGAVARVSVPVGQWRDGICDCCAQGICHPLIWNAYCCPSIAVAQVMTRMKLSLLGRPINMRHGAREAAKLTFQIILGVTLAESIYYYIIRPTYYFKHTHYDTYTRYDPFLKVEVTDVISVPDEGYESSVQFSEALGLLSRMLFYAATVYWTTRTRSYIRQKYGIPARYCGSSNIESLQASTRSCHYEDFCCSFCCLCCTASQMARHTMDYDTYPATCCTPTGVRDSVPDVV